MNPDEALVEPQCLRPQVWALGDPGSGIVREQDAANVRIEAVVLDDVCLSEREPSFGITFGRERVRGRAVDAIRSFVPGLPATRGQTPDPAEPSLDCHQAALPFLVTVTGSTIPALMNSMSADSRMRT
jgi:hypothetical protein